MDDSSRVVEVVHGLQHLSKIIARITLIKASRLVLLLDVREEVARLD